MASGISRSPWLPQMAAQLGWRTSKLRDVLRKHGYEPPWLDANRALKILAREGVRVSNQAIKQLTSQEITNVQIAARHSQGRTNSPEAIQKMKLAWSMKLIPRLARLLPEGDSQSGKAKVRGILRRGGYEGPRWDDEARAIAVFRAAGISTENFEYANGGDKSVASSNRPEQLSFVPRPQPQVATTDPDDAKRLQRIFTLLNMYEHQIMELIRRGHISKLTSPLELPINALNELRSHLKAN